MLFKVLPPESVSFLCHSPGPSWSETIVLFSAFLVEPSETKLDYFPLAKWSSGTLYVALGVS